MTILDEDESLAYEIIKELEWEDLTMPIQGIPKVTRLLKKYRKPTLRDQVLAFHKRFNQVIGDKPKVPDPKTVRFRMSLIAEEFFELLEATYDVHGSRIGGAHAILKALVTDGALKVDLPSFIDAVGDLMYVLEGTAIVFGVDMMPVFAEIQRANLSKEPMYVQAKDEHHATGNTIKPTKPEGWSPPDIAKVLSDQGGS